MAKFRTPSYLRAPWGALIDTLNPKVCESCELLLQTDDRHLCQTCWRDIQRLSDIECCARCGETRGPHLLIGGLCPKCQSNAAGVRDFDGFVGVGTYDGSLRELILKFKRRFTLDELLANLMVSKLAVAPFREIVDYWVPVPSHWWRRVRRGFQPTALLADQVAKQHSGASVAAISMRRLVPEFHRIRITPTARQKVIRGAFHVSRGVSVEGRHVCLVDDVMTTGATLREATYTLKKAGAKGVYVAVLARTPADPRIESTGSQEGVSADET